MNYELAKQLKDKGFRQIWASGRLYYLHEIGYKVAFDYIKHATLENGQFISYSDTLIMIPTLSELIEACGDGFDCLSTSGALKDYCCKAGTYNTVTNQWVKCADGPTPEEAVAHLWLALNK